MNVTKEQILEAIPKVSKGLNRYENIQFLLNNGVSVGEREFQKLFNGFYRIRARSKSWYESFYGIFENAKNEDWLFNTILSKLHERTGRFEASFASKIRASIDINAAVIDKIVLDNIGLLLRLKKIAL